VSKAFQELIDKAAGEAQWTATKLQVAKSWVGPSRADDDRDPIQMLTEQLDQALGHAMAALDQIKDLRAILRAVAITN
jgi:hypothetical protein